MHVYEFTLTLSQECFDEFDDAVAAFSQRCLDASFFSRSGVAYLSFHRQADSLENAIKSAIQDVKAAGYQVVRLEMDTEQCDASLASTG